MHFIPLLPEKYTANYQMIAGTTLLSSSNFIYQNIYSADECGKLCSNFNGFSCKSFDYCPDLSTCYLGKTHYYDVPQANIQLTPMCNHYSSKKGSTSLENQCRLLIILANSCRAWSWFKLFDILIVFLKDFFFKKFNLKTISRQQKRMNNYPVCNELS